MKIDSNDIGKGIPLCNLAKWKAEIERAIKIGASRFELARINRRWSK